MTIAIHMSAGNFALLTATDTQMTYASEEKVDAGKIMGLWRADPPGALNIAGAGDVLYSTALSQELIRNFKTFSGTAEQLEGEIRTIVGEFYATHILPFVGKLDDVNVPDFSLLIAARHEHVGKLWTVEKKLLTESALFECIGIGKPIADALLNRLYPKYPTLDSIAILAAYVIYRVKASVNYCGLKTEIRFIDRNRLGIVPVDLIEKWESLFQRYDRLERQVLYHAMSFVTRLPSPAALEDSIPPQMQPLSEIIKDIERMRAEFASLPIVKL